MDKMNQSINANDQSTFIQEKIKYFEEKKQTIKAIIDDLNLKIREQ